MYFFRMRLPIAAMLVLLPCAAPAQAPPVQTVYGVVRQLGDSSIRIAGAEIQIGRRRATSDSLGRFRIDSLPLQKIALRVRRIGYYAVHSRIDVVAGPPIDVDFRMEQSPTFLPTLEVQARRTGVYGKVGDASLRILPNAQVSVIGPGGGDALTDSTGSFAFPKAHGGTYLVSVRYQGAADRRTVVEVPKGSGKELTFRLTSAREEQTPPAMGAALFELRRRLAFEKRINRMAPAELGRFEDMRLCDIPKLRSRAGEYATVILNGVEVLEDVSICYWRADEIALIEFCGSQCFNPAARSLGFNRERTAGATIVLWEKR